MTDLELQRLYELLIKFSHVSGESIIELQMKIVNFYEREIKKAFDLQVIDSTSDQ